MVKHFLDSVVGNVPTIRNMVIVDFKGDLSQMVYPATDLSPEDDTYDDVSFELMTFGSGVGTFARTLRLRRGIDRLERFDLSESNPLRHRDEARFASDAKMVAKDLLLDIIVQNGTVPNVSVAASGAQRKERRSAFGLSAKDDEHLRGVLHGRRARLHQVPAREGAASSTYTELLEELDCAYADRCRKGEPDGIKSTLPGR